MTKIEMTPVLLSGLKEKAEKATPGEWLHCFSRGRWEVWIIDEQHRDILKEVSNFRENTAYIAAANPAVVLALIDEIERLEKMVERLEREVNWLSMKCQNVRKFPTMGGRPEDDWTAYKWREAARHAVKEASDEVSR